MTYSSRTWVGHGLATQGTDVTNFSAHHGRGGPVRWEGADASKPLGLKDAKRTGRVLVDVAREAGAFAGVQGSGVAP